MQTAPTLILSQPNRRVHVTQSTAPKRVEVRPTQNIVRPKPRNTRVQVLNDLAGIVQSLNSRLLEVITDGGRQTQVAPVTTGDTSNYILRTFGAPILTLYDGLGVWFTPHLSNAAPPVTLTVDSTGTQALKLATRDGITPLPANTLRMGTPTIAFWDSQENAWIVGTAMAELTQQQLDVLDLTLAQANDASSLAQLAQQGAEQALAGVPTSVQTYLDAWTADATSAFGQLQSDLTTLYYTSADTDQAIAGAVTTLETSLTNDITTLTATLQNDYYTTTTADSAIAAAIQAFDAGAANVTSIQSAVSDVTGYAEATAGFRVQAGNAVSLLDLVALNDGGVSYSVAKISADDIILDGTVTAPKLNVTELSAISADIGTATAGVIKSADDKFIIDLNNKTITITV